jgi:hypothetical protein
VEAFDWLEVRKGRDVQNKEKHIDLPHSTHVSNSSLMLE